MKNSLLASLLLCLATVAYSSENESKIIGSDTGEYDNFGEEMASDGDLLIVGASRYPKRGGAAYIYTWDGTSWGSEAKLQPHDHTKNDFFGSDVDLDGEYALVGARWHDPVDRALQNHKYGAAYFFRHAAAGWAEASFVQASDRAINVEFGGAVAISGEHAVIAAKFSTVNGVPGQGKVYVFQHKDSAWTETQILTAPDGAKEDYFGDSVDIDGDHIFVGGTNHARASDEQNVGAVWVFKRGAENNWDFATKLIPLDLEDGNTFGTSIHVSGELAIVGAALAHGEETGSGTAYIFRLGEDGWNQETRLTAKAGRHGDDFGHRVWIGDDLAVVGAWLSGPGDDFQRGAAYVFKKASDGWIESGSLSASDGGYEDQFGSAVSMGAGQVIVGASGEAAGGADAYQSGAVYSYGGVVDP